MMHTETMVAASERGPECPSCGIPFDQHDGFATMCRKLRESRLRSDPSGHHGREKTEVTAKIRIKGRAQKRRDPGEMTKTEKRYSEVLEGMRLSGEIQEWFFEPITLRLAKRTGWNPDFMVIHINGDVIFIEVKPSGWEMIPNQDMSNVKAKVAAEMYPFTFWRAVERTKKAGGGFAVEVIEGR